MALFDTEKIGNILVYIFIAHGIGLVETINDNIDLIGEMLLPDAREKVFVSTKAWRRRLKSLKRWATALRWQLASHSALLFVIEILTIRALWMYVTAPRPIWS